MVHERLFEYDRVIRNANGSLLCGVDEAGRGPLAGPVVCAAVILQPSAMIDGLDDPKRLTEKRRSIVYERIIDMSLGHSVAMIDNVEIDEINILNATMKGMREAVLALPIVPDSVLVDGNRVPDGVVSSAIIKGDSLSASIAAASVIAKTVRDRYMLEMDALYPEYHFFQHKGYPTKLHYEMIDRYGISPIHRKSFLRGRL